jgi:hypothetical protein
MTNSAELAVAPAVAARDEEPPGIFASAGPEMKATL